MFDTLKFAKNTAILLGGVLIGGVAAFLAKQAEIKAYRKEITRAQNIAEKLLDITEKNKNN